MTLICAIRVKGLKIQSAPQMKSVRKEHPQMQSVPSNTKTTSNTKGNQCTSVVLVRSLLFSYG